MAGFEREYFERVYDGEYDARNPRYKHRAYLREVLRVAPAGSRLLEVGCAYGAFLAEAERVFDVEGCDVSAHAVAVAGARVRAAKVFQADIRAIERPTPYDVIVCFDVLEHVAELAEALGRLRHLLKPRGALVVAVPVYDTVVGALVRRLDRDPTHVHKLSRYRWLEHLERAGFRIAAWKGIVRYHAGGRWYVHWCARIARSWSPAVLITAVREDDRPRGESD